jgi:hypothetical protein
MPVAFFLNPDQQVLHANRRAVFLHMSGGEAIIRYWGDSHAVAVSPEALSLPHARARSRRPVAASDQPITRDPASDSAATDPPVRRSVWASVRE